MYSSCLTGLIPRKFFIVPPTNTPVPQQPQVDAGLLTEVEAKIARHRDETGREDLEAAFSRVRDALKAMPRPTRRWPCFTQAGTMTCGIASARRWRGC
ncbi:MAG: hypothetical protein OXG49_12085, partial [Chloroflexi bacterium]|nr:hypothetical protein [Chloroflexota bacterium]